MVDLKEVYAQALKDKDVILKSLEPLRAEEEKAIEKVQSAEKELQAIRGKIVKVEVDKKLAEVSRIIATLAPKQKKLSDKG